VFHKILAVETGEVRVSVQLTICGFLLKFHFNYCAYLSIINTQSHTVEHLEFFVYDVYLTSLEGNTTGMFSVRKVE